MTDYKSMFEQAIRTLAAIDDALGIGDDGCCDPDQTLTAIAELKALQKMEPPQLRKIHPLDFPIEVFLADLTTRPANIIRAELASFASYAGTGTFDIEPPFTVRHLCMFSRSEMRKWPNFGRKCLNEVEEMLRARGLQLWENHDERSLRLLREHKEYFTTESKPMNQESKQAAEARRDAGMALATDKADRDAEGWSADARAALVRYAQENPHLQFLAEHVRQWAEGQGLVSAPENGRAWGSVFRNAAADGLIVRVGYAPADSSNRSPKCLWEAA